MTRSLLAAAALLTMVVPAAANAASYSAKLTVPVAASRVIDRDMRWSCGPDACQGSTADAPAMVLCQGLAKKAGQVESFLVNGRAFAVAELAKCNASAKAGTPAIGLARAN